MSAETEVELVAPWRPQDVRHPNSMTLRDFCEEHGLVSEFLPFNYLDRDMLSDMIDIHEFLETRRVTKQLVSTSNISEGAGVDLKYYPDSKKFLDSTALLVGWWDAGYSSAFGRYYANPNYVHSNERYHIPFEDRQEFFESAARVGIDYTTIAPALGVDSDDPRKICYKMAKRADVDYSTLKQTGYHNLIRTWITMHEWGYLYGDIAESFKKPEETVYRRAHELTHEADEPFDPPDEPSIERVK